MCILFRNLFINYTKKVHLDTRDSFYNRLVIITITNKKKEINVTL